MSQAHDCFLRVALLIALAFAPAIVSAQPSGDGATPPAPADHTSGVHAIKVQGKVWMIAGAGANIAMQVGEEGVVLVDTGAANKTDAVLAAIREVTDRPIRYIVNTSASPDHTGGNATIATLPGGSPSGKGRGPAPAIVAQNNVLERMSAPGPGGKSEIPSAAWPTDGYDGARRELYLNGEVIDVLRERSAHSDGDSIVYFRASNVLVAGDIFTTTNLPLIDAKEGGTSKGMLDAFNAMLTIAVPANMQEGGTYIIPGRGRICDDADLVEYRDMVHEIRDRMKDLVTIKHMTLDQVKAKRPLIGWEARYSRPEWTTDMLVETLYNEFKGNTRP